MQINSINTVVTKMEKYDKRNIITAQQQISLLQKKLQDCEDAILSGGGTSSFPAAAKKPSIGSCDHDGLLRVSAPVLVKLNWRGPEFKAGAWGKDVALGTKFPDIFWVFPTNMDKRKLETFRLYSTMKKLSLYSPSTESSFNKPDKKCTDCGQGAGVVFFNGSFYYNCYQSRDVCKADPVTKKVKRVQFKDKDPSSFNDFLSYKIAKFQDMDLAGDEQGMWLIHGSTRANGNVVIRKLDPNSLQIGAPWITTQPKERMTNSFMICGRLYATKELNATHEEIYYVYDTKTTREKTLKIPMEKPLPTVQSLKYNPNDQKLYLYNDGYLVYYNLTFKSGSLGRAGKAAETKQLHSSETELSAVNQKGGATPSQANPSSASDQQQDSAGNGETNAQPEEQPMSVTLEEQDTMREGDNYFLES